MREDADLIGRAAIPFAVEAPVSTDEAEATQAVAKVGNAELECDPLKDVLRNW